MSPNNHDEVSVLLGHEDRVLYEKMLTLPTRHTDVNVVQIKIMNTSRTLNDILPILLNLEKGIYVLIQKKERKTEIQIIDETVGRITKLHIN